MAEVIVSADASYGPPRNVIVAHATGGSILESCEVTRIVGGAEEPIRRQPIVGVSDVTLYDYEAPYDRSSVYRIQGLERSTLSTQWTSAPDSSTSTLLQDNSLIATQWFPNPGGDSTGTQPDQLFDGSISWKWGTRNAFALTKNQSATMGPFARFSLSGLIAGTGMRLSVEVGGTSSTGMRGPAVTVTKADDTTVLVESAPYIPGRFLTLNFTVPDDGGIHLKFRGNVNNVVGFYDIMLCSVDDWNAMQSLGVSWFDGDSFQAGTTTQYDESSSPVTLSPDSGWLIHPGNPAKSMRLPLGHITGMGDTTRRSNATRHDILGARYPIYTNPGPRYSRELSMKLRTRTADDENMLDALLDDQTPILFNPRGVDASRLNLDPMYLQVGDVTAARYAQSLYPTSDSPQHWRDWTLPCTQVDSPAVSQQAVGWTYAQLLNDNTRYQSVIISYKDYASLQAHSVKDGQ